MPQRKALSKFTHTCSFPSSSNSSTSTKSANRAGTACFSITSRGMGGAPGEFQELLTIQGSKSASATGSMLQVHVTESVGERMVLGEASTKELSIPFKPPDKTHTKPHCTKCTQRPPSPPIPHLSEPALHMSFQAFPVGVRHITGLR